MNDKANPRQLQLWIAAAITVGLIAFLVRLGFVFTFGNEEKIYDSNQDQYIYIDLAKNLVAGKGYQLSYGVFVASPHTPTAIQPPTYPFFVASVFATFGESLLAVRVIQAILSALVCVTALFIGGLAVNFSVGLASGIVAAFYPLYVMYTRPIMTETIYTLLLALIVLVAVIILRVRGYLWLYPLLGLLMALLFLTRPEAVLFFPLVLGLLVIPVLRRWQPIRHLIGGLVLIALTFGLTVTPWVLFTWRTQGEPLLFPNKRWGNWDANWLRYQRENNPTWKEGCTTTELECAIPNFDRLTELERDRYTIKLMTEFVREHPNIALRYAASRVLMSYPVIPREVLPPPLGYLGERERPTDGYAPDSLDDFPSYQRPVEQLRVWLFCGLLFLSLVAALLAFTRREWLVLLPGAMVLTNIVTAFITQGRERYRLPIDLYLIILAVYAVVTLVAIYQQQRQGRQEAWLWTSQES
ncbi:MAG: glycosyltransferase family 39 protein [Chloroflexaceae bacterium]|nr:glycosyltransferase family 39 protein [Chloroflexaceae bacterium]